MNKLRLVVVSLAVLAVMSVSLAGAEKQMGKGIAKDATQDRVQDVFGRGEKKPWWKFWD